MDGEEGPPAGEHAPPQDLGRRLRTPHCLGQTSVPSAGGDIGKETEFKVDDGVLAGKTIKLVYGDYAAEMAVIARHMKKAAENADNETERDMHQAYARSFDEGSLLAFKDSQRFWIRDKGPMVECNIGFIETYRDPRRDER